MAYYDPKQLAKDTEYVHELDIIKTNSRTKKIQSGIFKNINSPKRSISVGKKNSNNYNKWYVNPDHHFKQKSENPKKDKILLLDDMHIYKNLHNDEFWNWMHPFQKKSLPPIKSCDNIQKIDEKILEGFKRYMYQKNQNQRLPYIVDHILNNKRNRYISK